MNMRPLLSLCIFVPLVLSCASEEEAQSADPAQTSAMNDAVCGDGVCYVSEVGGACTADCAPGTPVCGNGRCSAGETEENCPGDCQPGSTQPGHVCGDGVCFIDELSSCPGDCAEGVTVCGNGQCGDGESFATCPEDCEETDLPASNASTSNGVVNTDCEYPTAPSNVQAGGVMPALSWEGAYNGDGSQVDFDLKEFYCNEQAWGTFTSALFIVSTGWCPACPDYIRLVGEQSAQLETEGMKVVFVEAEDRNSVPSTNEGAHAHISDLIGDATGLRVGDGETIQGERTIYNSPIVTGFPSAWVVRRSDMQIIADQGSSQYVLPFIDIARDPDAEEWVSTGGGGGGGAPSNCGAEDEEPFEPNDTPMDASTIEPGTYEGGVCSPGADFYDVALEGRWRLDLEFSHVLGDLDVHIWDYEDNEADRRSGSYSTTDNESFEHEGPATLMIYGYGLATAPYILTLTAF